MSLSPRISKIRSGWRSLRELFRFSTVMVLFACHRESLAGAEASKPKATPSAGIESTNLVFTPDVFMSALVMRQHFLFVWPPGSSTDQDSHHRIGLLGKASFANELKKMCQQKSTDKIVYEVLTGESPSELKSCQVVFISREHSLPLEKAIEGFSKRPVLLVGEEEEFLEKGGMVKVTVINEKASFEVNLKNVEKSGLKGNAYLFQSKIVILRH